MNRIKKNTLFYLGMLLGNSRILFPFLAFIPWRKKHLVNKNTVLVIDGFQRSGNTFFYSIVKHSNPSLAISIHAHSSLNAIKAIKKGRAVAVTIRHPLDSIKSLLVWDDSLSVSIALLAYIRYYNNLEEFRKKMVIVRFNTMITDPDQFIDQINEKFSLRLKLSDLHGDSLDGYLKRKSRINELKGDQSAYPSQLKERKAKEYEVLIKQNEFYEKALAIFERFEKR